MVAWPLQLSRLWEAARRLAAARCNSGKCSAVGGSAGKGDRSSTWPCGGQLCTILAVQAVRSAAARICMLVGACTRSAAWASSSAVAQRFNDAGSHEMTLCCMLSVCAFYGLVAIVRD